ncbi:MAG: DUF1304 domain-containing protein [Saprospiraceae bacterium]|nr:DUF1304 domain-containing protein [Saprospiraceae bacterium]
MEWIAKVLIALVAMLHLYFLWLEMFAWETRGKKVFKSLPEDIFTPTKVMAANQGLYNGFLSAGLIWSLLISDPEWWINIACFFLSCILVAGIYGAVTADRKIFLVQGLPALLALVMLWML